MEHSKVVNKMENSKVVNTMKDIKGLNTIVDSEVVKNHHKSLRIKVKQGEPPDVVWNELLLDKDSLRKYSESMNSLATSDWEQNCQDNRIEWCKQACIDYFKNGGLQKMTRKTYKQKLYKGLVTCGIQESEGEKKKIDDLISSYNVSYDLVLKRKYLLLDVGSCFNPFKRFEEFLPIPIDISPAIGDVIYCDFLNVVFEPIKKFEENNSCEMEIIVKNSILHLMCSGRILTGIFDIVIFSLLLSYFPTPSQRLKCCVNAHKSLKLYGLLVIVTPDSSHQNRHQPIMKSWREALEGLGFTRYKYEKLTHLHCMAYQKSSNEILNSDKDFSKHIYIPQDLQTLDEILQDKFDSSKQNDG